jgi:hypothetical protein
VRGSLHTHGSIVDAVSVPIASSSFLLTTFFLEALLLVDVDSLNVLCISFI